MTLPTKAMSKRWAAYVREHGSVIFLSDHPVLDLVDAYVDGVLVPVEPDYGKAEAMFQVVASTAIGLGLTPAVRAIVDAALGIGGDDEM